MAKKNNKNQALVPELRFPGFGENWKFDTLSKVLREHKRKNKDGCEVFSVSLEKGLINQIEHMGRSFSAKDTSNYNKVRQFDVVYTKSPLRDYPYGIVKQSKLDADVSVSPLYGVFSPLNRHIGALVEAYFDSPYWSKSFIGPLAQKGAKNTINITNPTFLTGPFAVPPSEAEQQKIADCLGSLDDLIAAHSRKLDALQDHKKGLLQQLFPAEGETTPQQRFSEFKDAGSWKVKPLGELVNYQNGKAHEKDILESGSYIAVNSKYISTEGKVVKRTNRAYCIANVGDVLMVLSDVPNGKAIAKCYFVKKNNLYTVNQRICKLTPTNIADKFLFYTLDKHRYFLEFDDGVKQTNLRKEDVLTCPIALPREPTEQNKIADCLSDLDALITAQSEQIAALKEHKRGLMQQLFPNPELNKP